ncbi:MAG: AAA family ATPase [Acidobacteriota bacterium]
MEAGTSGDVDLSRSATLVAVANQKGGVAKTTTSINLAACLGALEKKVLLVDCDPQGNATRGLGLSAESPHLYHLLAGECSPEEATVTTEFAGLDVIPADRELVGVEVEFVDQRRWEYRLREGLEPMRHRYDFIFLDCPPSLGHLTVNALTASDQVLVPLQAEYFALEGISELVATIRRVQSRLNSDLEIGGILLTMVDPRTNLSQDVAQEARNFFENRVFDAVIPRNIRLAEAPSHGLPILQYDIKSRGADAYLAAAREFMRRNP